VDSKCRPLLLLLLLLPPPPLEVDSGWTCTVSTAEV
jgi:hypothetical protein